MPFCTVASLRPVSSGSPILPFSPLSPGNPFEKMKITIYITTI